MIEKYLILKKGFSFPAPNEKYITGSRVLIPLTLVSWNFPFARWG
jgi:hypothetical protein